MGSHESRDCCAHLRAFQGSCAWTLFSKPLLLLCHHNEQSNMPSIERLGQCLVHGEVLTPMYWMKGGRMGSAVALSGHGEGVPPENASSPFLK